MYKKYDPEDIQNGTMSAVGAGNTNYVTMKDIDSIGDLPQSPERRGNAMGNGMRSNRSSITSDNSSLDLGNLNVSFDSTKSSGSVHEFCAVTGADTVGSKRSSIDDKQ